MWWVLLIAVAPNEYVINSVYETQMDCVLALEEYSDRDIDKCWPAYLKLVPSADGEKFTVYK